ncbi:MAG: AarF/ABC1/UbiB kinase family protein [Solirubrobacterales bacterium]|nr:AarF/ABC1/UbiB kinase family protein [Solirubrobacterales bacterium]
MNVLVLPLQLLAIVLTVLLFVSGVRRLLGVRLSPLRALAAGIVAFALLPLIINAVGASVVQHNHRATPVLPAFWFAMLGVAIALLIGMLLLVVAEALVPSGTLPGPLYVVRGVRRRLSRGRRYMQIAAILVRRGMLPYLRGARRAELASLEGRLQLALSLRRALEDGGATFVKLGQVLATRRDLLPPEFIDEFAGLQDDAPHVTWAEVEGVLRSALGADVRERFASFEQRPLAAASIAQVHAATLPDGEAVVVKVRRPGIVRVIEWDIDIIIRLARRLERATSWGRGVGAVMLAEGFAGALREELDLRIEASNLSAVAAAANAGSGQAAVDTPRAHKDMCTAELLVMERLQGRALRSIAASEEIVDREALAGALLDFLLHGVLLDGIFHADPHAGNVVLLDDGRLGMLDFGSVGRLDAALRRALQRLLLAVDRGDPALLCDALLDIVARPEELDEPGLARALGAFMARHLGLGAEAGVRMFGDLFRILAEHSLAVPGDIAAAFRSLATVEGTLTALAPGFRIVDHTRAFAAAQLAAQFSPGALRSAASDELVALEPIVRRLPRRIDRIGGALEAGRLTVNVRLLADARDRSFITGLVHQFVLAFMAATTGVIAVLLLGLHGGPTVTRSVSLYAFLGYSLLVCAGVLALRVLVLVFRLDADR